METLEFYYFVCCFSADKGRSFEHVSVLILLVLVPYGGYKTSPHISFLCPL